MSEHELISELQQTTRVVEHLIACGAQVREIRVYGRARPAIVLNRPPRLPSTISSNIYAWGIDNCGRHYERRACTIDGIQIQWENQLPEARINNIVPFPVRSNQHLSNATARVGATKKRQPHNLGQAN